MSELYDLTLSEAAGEIRSGALSPVQLMEALLKRSREIGTNLGVWATIDSDEAMISAVKKEREMQSGQDLGCLHGIPIGIKDIYYTKGVATTCSSPIYENFIPTFDSTAVALLKSSGAIIMGKTVTTQFACGDPPVTKNPWNVAHTPGGSSSGSAVGVAARIFPAAVGSQTAGSVLRPASYNGIVGLKPTLGRISRYGVVPVSWSLDTMGTFTRTVRDAAIMLKAMTGHNSTHYSKSTRPSVNQATATGEVKSAPSIGLVKQFYYETATCSTVNHTECVVRHLAEKGAQVTEVTFPSNFNAILSAHSVLMTSEAAFIHHKIFKTRSLDYSPKVRSVIESGLRTLAVDYVQAKRLQRKFQAEVVEAMAGFDVLLCPTVASSAPADLTTTGDPSFQAPWTTAGVPSISIPTGLSENGMPLGIQLVARPFDEIGLLSAASWCEKTLDFSFQPPV